MTGRTLKGKKRERKDDDGYNVVGKCDLDSFLGFPSPDYGICADGQWHLSGLGHNPDPEPDRDGFVGVGGYASP
jgi:hypothetical protein